MTHNQHFNNPETGQTECECCCGWALDYDKLRKQNDALRAALSKIADVANWPDLDATNIARVALEAK